MKTITLILIAMAMTIQGCGKPSATAQPTAAYTVCGLSFEVTGRTVTDSTGAVVSPGVHDVILTNVAPGQPNGCEYSVSYSGDIEFIGNPWIDPNASHTVQPGGTGF